MTIEELRDSGRRVSRRRLQLSLRSFLVALTVFMLWLGFQANSARQQRLTVAALEQAGVKVKYGFQFDAKTGYYPDAKPPYPKVLVNSLGIDFFDKVSAIECHEGDVDEVVTHIVKLRDVTACFLGGSKLSDDGLRRIAEMPNLERLGLEYTQVTDAGLESLRKSRSLQVVFLMGTNAQVSEKMIAALEEALPECEFVSDPGGRN